jgi:hypothetical protein
VCDRTALILDIFNQRAATHEAALQASPLSGFFFSWVESALVHFDVKTALYLVF